MDSLKMLMKVQSERRVQFQNAVDSGKNMINMENECHTKSQDEMNSVKMTMERTPSMPMKQMVCHPASKQPPIRMKVTQENLPCSFHVCS
jgi:hypothetical protein